MTTAIMLAKIRTMLDEASASYWSDTECYAALAHSQVSCIDAILDVYKKRYKIDHTIEMPEELRVLQNFDGAGIAASQINVPDGFIWLTSAKWDNDATGGEKPCRIVSMDRAHLHREDNSFLAATSSDPIAYVAPEESAGTQSINFRPAYSSNANYSIYYLKYPTAIASGQEPTLPESAHNAIVAYATYYLLMKDERPQEAGVHLNVYIQEIKTLVGV